MRRGPTAAPAAWRSRPATTAGAASEESGRLTTNSLPHPGAAPGPGAPRGDRAVVLLDEPPHQRETEAEPALGAVEGALRLREEVEDAGHEVGRHPDARVAHAEDTLGADALERDVDPAPGRRVLDRVVDQVEHHLLEPYRVTARDHRGVRRHERRA